MGIDITHTQDLLKSHLCSQVRIVERRNGKLVLETPFSYPDGDRYPIFLHETATGGIRLSDGGHTFMHLSYENEMETFRRGTRERLLEQILGETGLRDEDGEFSLETSLDGLAEAVFRFGQGLTKIYDLVFLNRARVTATFYEDLFSALAAIVTPDAIARDFVESGMDGAEDYPIDYRIPGKNGDPLFVFGVPGRDKARLATIILERLLRYKVAFDSLLVFADQTEIPRRDLARLTNVGGEMVSSLDAQEDLSRKILRKVA
ncbi:MAG: DUF1828 domain-containing protein [Candidatus Hydrogenedens sp.]|mgnify:CR=1 FL=1|nr:DUF1828 domain-containing protein [Candidatus Hydrogenedentota bacterium]NLF57326.1 DUF1828 domain-containing protein [Candidatus Hydrogenedens sp.]